MFNIVRHPSFTMFIFKREGKGSLPAALTGMFTSVREAGYALAAYELACVKAELKVAEAEKKIAEAEAKPLGHTQKRKPSNAKKPSTSGK